jgi:hypothetical protein
MLKRTIGLIVFTLLAGCQTAQKKEYLAACQRAEVPFSCEIDMNRPCCGPISLKVETCSRFIEKAMTAEEIQQARAKGFDNTRYQNPGAPKILLGMKDLTTTQVPVYLDSTSLESYVRSLDLAKILLASRTAKYTAAAQSYLEQSAAGKTGDVKAMEAAISDIQKLKVPLEQAAAAGAPISRFYAALPPFYYRIEVNKLSNQLEYRNEVLIYGGQRAISRQQASFPYPSTILADVAVAQFGTMADEVDKAWPSKLTQDMARGKTLAAAYVRQKARIAAAQQRERQYHQMYQAAPEPRKSNGYSDGDCSCSGRNVCYGPRDGRYCITSGGNKRYGI